MRPPPVSTLFPYTTLFRSHADARDLPDRAPARLPASERAPDVDHARHAGNGHHRQRPLDLARPDRKSTRLNSSHSQTSYAVFCLKKKTITPGRPKITPSNP